MKKCKKCLVSKEPTEFYKHKTGAQGLSASCKHCKKNASASWYSNNKKRKAYTVSKWQIANKEHISTLNKLSYRRNLAENRAKRATYHKEHKQQEKLWRQQYLKNNPHLARVWVSKRRTAKMQRFPKWLTALDLDKITEFYVYAELLTQATGIAHEVDHIIPLQGKNISGLHIPTNLQILTRYENRSKGNKV